MYIHTCTPHGCTYTPDVRMLASRGCAKFGIRGLAKARNRSPWLYQASRLGDLTNSP